MTLFTIIMTVTHSRYFNIMVSELTDRSTLQQIQSHIQIRDCDLYPVSYSITEKTEFSRCVFSAKTIYFLHVKS